MHIFAGIFGIILCMTTVWIHYFDFLLFSMSRLFILSAADWLTQVRKNGREPKQLIHTIVIHKMRPKIPTKICIHLYCGQTGFSLCWSVSLAIFTDAVLYIHVSNLEFLRSHKIENQATISVSKGTIRYTNLSLVGYVFDFATIDKIIDVS